ncbi:hypothetical protein C3B58_12785 [Lactonifactor longoviformis]|uniref:Uncharacterized protein n=1 Tax=Lactonifactor longoviformis DSM 17459 TaxID=1122155 RepID=A0A1M5D655_9CLOT|nr:hypothetical protein [Lactonifactor longoviformis]POP32273.1 hypothetical protein C3B58_12785 [Lactonifactor longoviformis]SHF62340.1 hypothetical protein SAMN02745158_04426 [Lactonifactor longoviformis DSM 17459]
MTKQSECKPSEIIEDFINLIAKSHEEYETNISIAKGYDSKTITWIHDFETANDYDERCKLATALHKEREIRRKHKDRAKLFQKIHEFAGQERNKQVLKSLKWLLSEQRKQEEYLESDREFKHRVGDDGNGDTN